MTTLPLRLLPLLIVLSLTGPAGASTSHEVRVYVRLNGAPAVALALAVPPAERGAPGVVARVNQRIAQLEAQHDALRGPIAAAGGRVIADLVRLTNTMHVVIREDRLDVLRALPGVVGVERTPIYGPHLASAVPRVNAPAAWGAVPGIDGEGIVIGIVDSGIDYEHGDLGGSGDPAAFAANDPSVVEEGSFPTEKVIGGWDFVGADYDAQNTDVDPAPDEDPLDCFQPQSQNVSGGHGTHVAGIAAGNGVLLDGSPYDGPYDQTLDPFGFRVFPGVAPRASLFALKIFGCNGSTDMLASALELAADPNQDGDFTDRLDVVNASLGSSFGLSSGAEAEAVANLTSVGTLMVVASGNAGGVFYIAGSPGIYPQVLSVAASSDADYRTVTVDSPASVAGDYIATEGGFTKPLGTVGTITAPMVSAEPQKACAPLSNGAAISGKIVLIERGDCLFVTKFQHAVDAGAIAVIVVDNEYSALPFAMGGGDGDAFGIPGVLIRRADGETIAPALAEGVVVTLDPAKPFTGLGAELITGFSSRGPSSHDNRMKPEVAAPGFSIDSAQVASGFKARQSQGTSMACPMVAGAAALVRQARPELGPGAVKAALINTSTSLTNLDGDPYPASLGGAGRIDAAAAVATTVVAHSDEDEGGVTISLGAIAAAEPWTGERDITLTNFGDTEAAFQTSAVGIYDLPGVSATVEPNALIIPPGETVKAVFTLSIDPEALGAPGPDPLTPPTQYQTPRHWLTEAQGHVVFESDADLGPPTIRVPYYAVLRGASDRWAAPIEVSCDGGGALDEGIEIVLEGTSAHPEPVVTAFELGAWNDPDEAGDKPWNLLAVGAATSGWSAEAMNEVSLSFGVAVAGEWSTPALGPHSVVGVLYDTDGDDEADYATLAEPLNRFGPYADALAATTYKLGGGGPQNPKRFINIVSAADYPTYPFNTNVVVLSVFASSIGLTPDNSAFKYKIFTDYGEGAKEDTDWIPFDALAPGVDTSRSPVVENRPVYPDTDTIVVHPDPDALADGDLQVLLLHHTNALGSRWEVVDLSPSGVALQDAVVDALDGPTEVVAGEEATVAFQVINASSEEAEVGVDVTVEGGQVVSTTPEDSCEGESCDFGTLAPGDSRKVSVTVVADAAGAPLQIQVEAWVDGCEGTPADNTALATLTVVGPPEPEPEPEPLPEPPPPAPEEPRGTPTPQEPGPATVFSIPGEEADGCAAGGAAQPPTAAWLAVALCALLGLARRRRAPFDFRPESQQA